MSRQRRAGRAPRHAHRPSLPGRNVLQPLSGERVHPPWRPRPTAGTDGGGRRPRHALREATGGGRGACGDRRRQYHHAVAESPAGTLTARDRRRRNAALLGEQASRSNAFPSGHTTAAAAVGVALLFVVPARHLRSAAVAGALLTAAVASAVVLLGWHYPSDALGAILVAALWGCLMDAVLRATSHPRRRPHHQESTAVHGDLIASGD